MSTARKGKKLVHRCEELKSKGRPKLDHQLRGARTRARGRQCRQRRVDLPPRGEGERTGRSLACPTEGEQTETKHKTEARGAGRTVNSVKAVWRRKRHPVAKECGARCKSYERRTNSKADSTIDVEAHSDRPPQSLERPEESAAPHLPKQRSSGPRPFGDLPPFGRHPQFLVLMRHCASRR